MVSTSSVHIADRNAEQAAAWDGSEGAYWATHAGRFDACVARHHAQFTARVDIGRAYRTLDVGCGTGQVSRDAARRAPDGLVLGVDLSAGMLAVAREQAARAGLTNTVFEQADAQVHQFGTGSFDLVLSRTGAMFFGDPRAAFANLAGALRPDGALAMLA